MAGLALAHPVLAQGCALCYNTAAAANARGVAALRNGILILMIAPVIIFGVVCFFTLRGRNRFNEEVEPS
jgi:heme/copper-type cytochrome/quinol oxidase subunit 2